MASMSNNQKILVVGGGFAGVKAAVELEKCEDCDVTLLSDHTHFRYYPATYRAATGGKHAGSHIRLSNILDHTNITFQRGIATKLDREKKQIITAEGKTYHYDKLILALGSVNNYFGIEGLKEYSFNLKTYEAAEQLRKHLHSQFIAHGCPDLNYLIVGAGPTGVELAGTLPQHLRDIMRSHGIKDCKLSIKLIEAAPRILPRSPKHVSRAVAKRLRSMGIKIMTNCKVEGQNAENLMVNGAPIQTHTVIWTAGVTNHPFFKDNNFALTDRGKVIVDEYLQAEPNIYVLGDNANTPYSGLAPTALHDGDTVAVNIMRSLGGLPPKPYQPKQPTIVMPIGERWASVEWRGRHITGLTGWLMRQIVEFNMFNDIQSWPQAGKQWMTTMSSGNPGDCPYCQNDS